MKTKLLIIYLLCAAPSLAAQQNDKEDIANGIVSSLQGAEAIKVLLKNKEIVYGQAQDIALWTRENKISPETYYRLKASYIDYSEHMNNIVDNLSADLLSIESFRQLKGARLQKFIKKFSNVYIDDLDSAYDIYSSELVPAIERAQFEAGSKGGIIPALVAVFKFGKSIFTAIKDIFSEGRLSKEGERELLQAAVRIAITNIEKKLKYPTWKEINPHEFSLNSNIGGNASFASTVRNPGSVSINPAPVYRTMHGSVGLSTYRTDQIISLMEVSKSIVVGSESRDTNLPVYAVANPMQNGDRFWVTLEGYEFVSFFYYDENLGSWQDPFGKSIVVGSDENGRRQLKKYLPSPVQFFEIAGTSVEEQFLIIVSNAPMPETHRKLILNNPIGGMEFLADLSSLLPNVVSPVSEPVTSGNKLVERISINISGATQIYTPLYIRIDKN